MKKILPLFFLVLFFLFIPIVFAEGNVIIDSISVDSKSEDATIVNEATYDGLLINFDVKFKNVDDFVRYKLVIVNQSDEDYGINVNFDNSEYISYKFSTEDGDSNILSKNSETTFYIDIKYKAKIPKTAYENSTFVETNNLTINLANDNDEETISIVGNESVDNPLTRDGLTIIIALLIISAIVLVVFYKKTKRKKYLVLLIIGLLLIPLGIKALEELKISVNSVITVDKKPYAKDVLLIDYQGELKSPYVYYKMKNGEDVLCRVLYDKHSQYGLQIVTMNPVGTVKLGSNDPKVSGTGVQRAQNSYMRAITTLNEEAESYMNTDGIAADARSIGSNPLDKDYPDYLTGTDRTSLYWNSGSDTYEYWLATYLNKFFFRDENYVTDTNQLNYLELYGFEDTSYSTYYWMASRTTGVYRSSYNGGRYEIFQVNFGIMAVDNTGYYGYPYEYLFLRGPRSGNSSSYDELYYEYEKGLRPVFIISDEALISSGDGTLENPYTMEFDE